MSAPVARLRAVQPADEAPAEVTPEDRLAAAQAVISEVSEHQRRAFQTALDDLVELAERLSGADACQPVGVREVARRVRARIGDEAKTLRALMGRAGS